MSFIDERTIYDATDGKKLPEKLTELSGQLAETEKKWANTGEINIKDFGAKGDYIESTNVGSDDTLAILAAIEATPTGGTLRLPTGNYKTTDSIIISKEINVIMDGAIHYAGTKDKVAFKVSPPSNQYFRNRVYKLAVKAVGNPTNSEWANDNFVGIQLDNLQYCEVTVDAVDRFGLGVVFCARDGAGFAWNEIYLGRFRDNREQVSIQSVNGGWPNANNVYGGSIELSGNFLNDFGGTRKFIAFRKGMRVSDSSMYGGNAWFFYSPRFEGGGQITQGSLRVFWFDDLYRNINVVNARFEYVGINNIAKSSIVYIEKPSLKATTDIKINGYFTYVVPYVRTSDGNPLPLSDIHVVNYAKHSDGNPWQQMFYTNLIDHYFYGVNNGQRWAFDNMHLFSTNNAQFGFTSFYDKTDPMDYANKKIGVMGADGAPSLKITVKKGDRFKIVTDGRYQVAVFDTAGVKMNMPEGTEIIATRNGHFVRFGGSYVDFYQSDVIGFNEVEIIVNSDSIGYLILGASQGNSYFDLYKNKENSPNSFDQVKNYHSTAVPVTVPKYTGQEILKTTPAVGTYRGWVGIGGTWKGFGMIEA